MKIYLATAGSFVWNAHYLEEFKQIALQDRVGTHIITADPAEADIILFIDLHQHVQDWWMGSLHRHPLAKKYPHKIFVYDERDQPWYVAPGVYVSLSKSTFDARCQSSCCYFTLKNEAIEQTSVDYPEPDLLFSFLGAMTHPVRTQIVALKHERALIEDTTALKFFEPADEERKRHIEQQKLRYKDILLRSKFVLCPRGAGPSSYRLFESLALGRVPVIISDEWVEPQGPEWDSCSIRISESQVKDIPQILESQEASFQTLSKNASQIWHDWFAPPVRFHRLVEACALIQASGCRGPQSHPMLRKPQLRYGLRLLRSQTRKRLSSLKG